MSRSSAAGIARPLFACAAFVFAFVYTAPARAQIETVTVTAERKSENIQTTPVAVTALSSKDLKAKQVTNFRDLQFHVPSVTYTKSNFGGAQFQIRGITTQFGLGAAIAQNLDDVYLEAPNLVSGEYYDVDRVEVARGPQSTSYGRAATGGAVNIITTKPDLDDFAARASVDYGTFQTIKPDGMVNIPIIDGQLGVRLAVHGSFHNGYEQNIYDQLNNGPNSPANPNGVDNTHFSPTSTLGQTSNIYAQTQESGPAERSDNNLGILAGRASVRWEPNDNTTVDLVGDVSFENDRRTRGDKLECHFDPAGVAGCLPDKLGFQGFNTAATLGISLGSAQGIAAALSGALSPAGVLASAGLPAGPPVGAGGLGGGIGGLASILPTPLSLGAAQLIGNTVGLCSIAGNGALGDPAGPVVGSAFLGLRLAPLGPAPGIEVVPQTPEQVDGPCTGALGNGNGGGYVSKALLKTNNAFNPKYKTYGGTYLLNWTQTITPWLKSTVDGGFIDGYQFTQQNFTDGTQEDLQNQISQAQSGFNIVFGGDGYPGLGSISPANVVSTLGGLATGSITIPGLPIPVTIPAGSIPSTILNELAGVCTLPQVCGIHLGALATNGQLYDNAYFNVPGSIPVSNLHYSKNRFGNYGGLIDNVNCPASGANGGPKCGWLLKSPFDVSYDEDWFVDREWTAEARFQTSFKGPLNFSAGLFYMDFVGENQYWVAANSLDWESAVLGAFLTPCNNASCSTNPYMLAMPTFDAEVRRGLQESRSAFLEGTYDITDDLKVIAGGRFNDDRASYLRTTKCAGGGLFANNAANPTSPGGPCDSTQFVTPDPGAQTCSDPVYGGTPPAKACNDTNGPAGLTSLYTIGSNPMLPVNTRLPTLLTGERASSTDLWTGRVSINWSPKLDFTDQTFIYFTASQGELAGGINVPNNAAQTIVPVIYKPSVVESLELGVKNTLLNNSLTANLTAWYYNYQNYQITVIANRQALTLNIPAHLYGLEGEFLWQPTDDLAFNLTISATRSAAGTIFVPDERNPTNNVPGSILVRDITNGSICVVQPMAHGNTPAAPMGSTPGDSNLAVHVDNFYLPNGGNSSIDAGFGIPLVNYGICGGQGSVAQAELEAKGFEYSPEINPKTGKPVPGQFDGTGFPVNLHGNELPQVPFGQVGVGAQYTFHADDFNIVPRVDYYWQSAMQARVWNDPVVDRIGAWDVMNAQVRVSEGDSKWYFEVFAKNIFDKQNPTGEYLQDPAAGGYTNMFAEDPRIVGFSIGDSW